jgi:uncharacterized protein YlxP (DUF503 family)
MQVATCVITLQLYGIDSLKGKRRILKSILVRLPQQFNVAAAETDCQDAWSTAVIGLVTVGNDAAYLHGLLEKAVAWVATQYGEAVLADYSIEFL